MSGMQMITIHLTAEQLRLLDELVADQFLPNRSEGIRASVWFFLHTFEWYFQQKREARCHE